MNKTIVLSGPQGSGKTKISTALSALFTKPRRLDFYESEITTIVSLKRHDLIIIEDLLSVKHLKKLAERLGDELPFSLIIETQLEFTEDDFYSQFDSEKYRLIICEPIYKEFHCSGIDLITAERIRQVEEEGFTPDKDLEYTDKQLEDYAIFLLTGNDFYFPVGWDVKWKEKRYKRSRRENVIKAAALLAAHLNVMLKTEESNVNIEE